MGKNPEMSFTRRFARENTNDNGQKLNIKSAEIVVRQFKIYMIGVYKCLCLQNKHKGEGSPFIKAPFMPPPLVSRCWDMFMTYTQSYMNFCNEVYGNGKILIKDNSPMDGISAQNYFDFQKDIEKAKWPYNRFKGLTQIFPSFKKKVSLYKAEIENENIVWLTAPQIKEAKSYFREQLKVNGGNKTDTYELASIYVPTYIKGLYRDLNGEHSNIIEDIKFGTISKELGLKLKKGLNQEFFTSKVTFLNELKFPRYFNKKLSQKLCITPQLAEKYIGEYKKFVLMCACSSVM